MTDAALPSPGVIALSDYRPRTGHGVRIVVIDSGVHAAHPHIGSVAGGVGIDAAGHVHDDYVDRLGHGTAVAAAIREKAPDAEMWIVKVFDRDLTASADALVAAIEWALSKSPHLINLSLGTANPAHAPRLREAVQRVRSRGAWLVAAGPHQHLRWLPGSLDDVVSVALDWTQPRDACAVEPHAAGVRVRASGWPRPIPGVSPERNLKGLSFAVANATGLLAVAIQAAALPAEY